MRRLAGVACAALLFPVSQAATDDAVAHSARAAALAGASFSLSGNISMAIPADRTIEGDEMKTYLKVSLASAVTKVAGGTKEYTLNDLNGIDVTETPIAALTSSSVGVVTRSYSESSSVSATIPTASSSDPSTISSSASASSSSSYSSAFSESFSASSSSSAFLESTPDASSPSSASSSYSTSLSRVPAEEVAAVTSSSTPAGTRRLLGTKPVVVRYTISTGNIAEAEQLQADIKGNISGFLSSFKAAFASETSASNGGRIDVSNLKAEAPAKSCLALPFAHSQTVPCFAGANLANGQQCVPLCAIGYKPSKEAKDLTCKDGELPTFSCDLRKCEAPRPNFAPSPSCAEGAEITNGSICTPRCNRGYIPSVPSLMCINTQPLNFTCIGKNCTSPKAVSFAGTPTCKEGPLLRSGTVCTPNCAIAYDSIPASLTCLAGNLSSGGVFTCNVSKGLLNTTTPPVEVYNKPADETSGILSTDNILAAGLLLWGAGIVGTVLYTGYSFCSSSRNYARLG